MFMNDLSKERMSALSPLAHDYEGRFSRKGGKVPEKSHDSNALDMLLSALLMSFLLMADFLVFAGSGNIRIFENSVFPSAGISLALGGILLFSAACAGVLYKCKHIRHILLSAFSLFFVYIVYRQFSQYYEHISIGSMVVPVYVIFGMLFAAMVFIIFEQKKVLYRVLLVTAAGVFFARTYISYMNAGETHEFVESFDTQRVTAVKGKKFIYLMLPNLASDYYISTFNSREADESRCIIRGFLQKNNFRIYDRAYTPQADYLYNMAAALNPGSETKAQQNVLKNRMLTEYWKFHNLRSEFVYLKNNELYDAFRKNGFQISAYKSRDFDMCRKNYQYNVERCVEKVNRPANFYDMKDMTVLSKTGVLLIDWLSSMKIFDGVLPLMYKFLHPVTGSVDKMPMVGVNYNNLYVVNSVKTFDVLLSDIKKDTGKQAYFVFADLPSDMYIYDEYCRIRPQTEWFNRTNLPWVKRDYTYQRRNAYLQQTRCLAGKLEQFIRELQKAGIWKDTVLAVAGTSGLNNFRSELIDDTAEDFISNRSVGMAIHDPGMKTSEEVTEFCSADDFMAEYLYGTKKCGGENQEMHANIINEIMRRMDYRPEIKDCVQKFDGWYGKWREANGLPADNKDLVRTETTPDDMGIPDLAPETDAPDLNKAVFP